MRFGDTTLRILVRGNYGKCFDFYTNIIGLVPVWGDRNGPYTSFAISADAPPCFAIFSGGNMSDFEGYIQPQENTQPDTICGVIPTDDLDCDYKRLCELGVKFVSEPRMMAGWGMRCTYFRDPEGNLFELNDATTV